MADGVQRAMTRKVRAAFEFYMVTQESAHPGDMLRAFDNWLDSIREDAAETAPTEWEYAIRADGDSEPYSDISDGLDWLYDMETDCMGLRDHVVRRRKAGPWEPVDASSPIAPTEWDGSVPNDDYGPWGGTEGCFGHCDPEGWYAKCRRAAPTEDVREALARALYDIDPLPLHRGEGDEERIVGSKPWDWLGEGTREHLRTQADAILARFTVTPKEEL